MAHGHFVVALFFLASYIPFAPGARSDWPVKLLDDHGNVNFGVCADRIHNTANGSKLFTQLRESITTGTGELLAYDTTEWVTRNASCEDTKPLCFVTAITYDACWNTCGGGPETFRWDTFSQQFGNWLLPWLALLSQLPCGADDRLANLNSVILAVGSPALAAFCLALTAINTHWVSERFATYRYPNVHDAVAVLSGLQQTPLRLRKEGELLTSLVALHHNDAWWSGLKCWLDHSASTYVWSISAVANLSWVVVAFIFTIINTFTTDDKLAIVNSSGQANGVLWLWLLAVVIGWLRISPKCDAERLSKAVANANGLACVATTNGDPVEAKHIGPSDYRALSLYDKNVLDPAFKDYLATPPIYNYARVFSWTRNVEEVARVFAAANKRDDANEPLSRDGRPFQMPTKATPRPPANREGTRDDVQAYCSQRIPAPHWTPGLWKRIAVASALAMLLQWGSTGSAILDIIYTPARGLGCRSGAYVLYGVVATVVWVLMLLSSVLTHYSISPAAETKRPIIALYNMAHNPSVLGSSSTRLLQQPSHSDDRPNPRSMPAFLAIALRRTGKILAAANTCFVLVTCTFQFANVYDSCYCNSSVLGRGSNAYTIIDYSKELAAIHQTQGIWVASLTLGIGSVLTFLCAIWLYLKPRTPGSDVAPLAP
ncbi:hypothetical protein EV715DRAFT_285961 [Schizophyllum commune]